LSLSLFDEINASITHNRCDDCHGPKNRVSFSGCGVKFHFYMYDDCSVCNSYDMRAKFINVSESMKKFDCSIRHKSGEFMIEGKLRGGGYWDKLLAKPAIM
jgi:hypothetical protein